jgi:hypothetical protein
LPQIVPPFCAPHVPSVVTGEVGCEEAVDKVVLALFVQPLWQPLEARQWTAEFPHHL